MAHDEIETRADLPALTGLRFVAAAAVVAFHFVRWRFDPNGFLRQIMSCGFLAVGLFFVLSGFILVYAHGEIRAHDRSARRAVWRARFARVYPVYALGMIFGAAVSLSFGWVHAKDFESLGGALKLGAVAFMLTGVSRHTMFLFNWAAWSLTSELLFYFLFPLVVEKLRSLPTRRLIVFTSLATLFTLDVVAVYTKLDPDSLGRSLRIGDEQVTLGHYVKFFPLMHVHEFAWGLLSGICWMRFYPYFKAISSRVRDLGMLAIVVIATTVAMLGEARIYLYLHSGLLAPLFAMLVVLLASGPSLLSRALSMRPIVLLGEASYAIYMLHVPLFLLMDRWLEPRLSANVRSLVCIVALSALSITVHHAFEKPLRNILAKRKPDLRPAST